MQIESKGVGLVLLSTNDIARLLRDRWGIRGKVDSVVPGTSKVFRVETSEQQYYARLSSSRRDFSADQVVEFINFLGNWGAAVPVIIPTKDGQLADPIGKRCLSVERALPGTMCDSTCLSILPEAGKQLARLHDISVHFPGHLREKRPVRDFVGPRLRSVLRSRIPNEAKEAITSLTDSLPSELLDVPVAWVLTHYDLRSANAIRNGENVAYTDIGAVFQPRLCDLVMVQDRWLLHDPAGNARPLTTEETRQFWEGYVTLSPLSEEEKAVVGIIWASYSADRLSHWLCTGQKLKMWEFRERIAVTPELLRFPEEILKDIG